MNHDEAGRKNKNTVLRTIMPAANPWYRENPWHQEDPGTCSSGELLRLFLVPTIATALLVGGVYWVRLRLPAGPAGQDQASIVQVHLLPRPEPAPIPVAGATQPLASSVASLTDTSVDDPDHPAGDDTPVVPWPPAPTQVDAPAPSVAPATSAIDAPPSAAIVEFQQALLRRVKRYKRYPNAVRLGRLQGSVETSFAMRRDGTVLGVWVKTSSGQAVLDKEAVDTIRRAQPLPPIPAGMPDPVNFDIVLAFAP
jgi:protein TonB